MLLEWNTEKLIGNSKKYFDQQGVLIDWKEISKLKLLNKFILRNDFPCSVSEKQKILEVPDLNEAANTLNEITKFGFYEDQMIGIRYSKLDTTVC